jgi:hypothetical protein
MLDAIESALRWTLLVVFGLAAAEKAEALLSGSARWHPALIARPWRRRHATLLVGGSLLADLAATGVLIFNATWGAFSAGLLVLVYSYVATWPRPVALDSTCQCFWRVLDSSTVAGLLTRNGLLFATSLMVIVTRPRLSIVGLPLGAIYLAGLSFSVWAVDYLVRPRPRTRERDAEAHERRRVPVSVGRHI